jgi:hypothetical protein
MIVGAYTLANTTPPTSGARKVTVTHTQVGGVTDTLGTVTVTGTNLTGDTISEVLTPVSASTVTGTKNFATIVSVVGAGWVINTGNDTIVVGCAAPAIVREGGGTLHSVMVNTTAAGTITIADSGGTIAVLPASVAVGTFYPYDVAFSGYLSFTVAAASDITVISSDNVSSGTAFATRTLT